MSRSSRGMSALEFELEQDAEGYRDGLVQDTEADRDSAFREHGDEFEQPRQVSVRFESEAGSEEETDEEFEDDELETDDELEAADDFETDALELGSDEEFPEPDRRGFADRLYELSLRQNESELELDHELEALFREMEQEYFFRNLGKRLRQGGKALIKTAARYAKNSTPLGNVMNAATSLATGNMRGLLKSAVKLASQHPALAAAMPVLKTLGFDGAGTAGKAPWQNIVNVAKHAYGDMARRLDKEALTPAGASRIANAAFHTALQRTARSRGAARRQGGKKIVHLRPGDTLVVRVR